MPIVQKGPGRPQPDLGRLHSQLRDRFQCRLLARLPHRPAVGRQRHHAVAGAQLFPAPVHQSRSCRSRSRQPQPQGRPRTGALDASTTYIELDTVNRELAAAQQQETFTADLVRIEQQRNEAGVDSDLDLLQARLTAAKLKLQRLHLETRAATLAKQLAVLTGLPVGSILPDHASIPRSPKSPRMKLHAPCPGINSANALALSKRFEAKGDDLAWKRPQIGFGAVYNYDSNELNSYSTYYNNFTPNNVSFGLQITIPFFDFALRAKARATAAEALRATVEAEQAQRQNDVQIATLTGSLRELDALAEVAGLKQQIADAQLKAVLTQLEVGNGASTGPNAQPQTTPKSEQLARIDERQKYQQALDASLDLAKARLNLLRALGHMDDWLNELRTK
jgi:outer membrane protein TolC